ncbi:PE-PGRS family protein [Streptomyces sp. NPDC087270]|uniref:PE-PGRS family protein n=1 Tax=Streptomyces sp. NPDC087270 TaxID=3365774 RepID=UPI0037FDFE1B
MGDGRDQKLRSVDPVDLEQLATLLDGKGPNSLKSRTDAAFRSAAALGATSHLNGLRPLARWADDTAPDLRRRAARARMNAGDLTGGFLWAGFSAQDLAKYKGDGLSPELALVANSVAASDDPKASQFRRRPNENLDDWIDRLKAQALTALPGLQPFEPAVQSYLTNFGDWKSATDAAGHVIFQGSQLTKVLVGNSFKKGWLRQWQTWAATKLRGPGINRLADVASRIDQWEPRIRSLSAPGAWLPSKLTSALQHVPGLNGMIGDLASDRWDPLREKPLMNLALHGVSANKVINFLVGNDKLAKQFGGLTHSGVEVKRAAHANLARVGAKAYRGLREGTAFENVAAKSRYGAALKGLATVSETAGAFRSFNIVTSVAMTGISTANLISDGNPVKAFKREGAGYVADAADTAFNASLTATLIAPNPVTFGLTIATGSVYAGAEVVQHWGDIKKGTSTATHWVDKTTSNVTHDIASGAKSAAKKLNPTHWHF